MRACATGEPGTLLCELGNTPNLSRSLNNLGITYNLMGRPDLALKVYRENLACSNG